MKYINDLEKSWNIFYQDKSNSKCIKKNIDFSILRKKLKNLAKSYLNKIEEFLEFISIIFRPKSELNQVLFLAELWPKFTPTKLVRYLISKVEKQININKEHLNIIGALAVLWTSHQRLIRCLKFLEAKNESALLKELLNIPHENWTPSKNPGWLLLELEGDFAIRKVQVNVARKMIKPPKSKNTMMQLNMGEGKTSVIIPMLVTSLANKQKLVRIIVLKSLFNTNYSSLVQKLGCLLNKRIYFFPCSRDNKFTLEDINMYKNLSM